MILGTNSEKRSELLGWELELKVGESAWGWGARWTAHPPFGRLRKTPQLGQRGGGSIGSQRSRWGRLVGEGFFEVQVELEFVCRSEAFALANLAQTVGTLNEAALEQVDAYAFKKRDETLLIFSQ